MADNSPKDKNPGEELRYIVQRLGDEADEKNKQAKNLRNLADNIEEAATHFWTNPKFKLDPLPSPIQNAMTSTGATISSFGAYLRKREVGEIGKNEIVNFVIPTGDFIALSTNTSAITSFPKDYIPVEIMTRNEEQSKKEFVENNLPGHLSPMFRQAWESFNNPSSDPERAAAFMMHEVVSQLFHFEAPDEHVKSSGLQLENPKKPSRKERSDFIVSHAPSSIKETFEKILKNLRDSYDTLNIAHKHASLDNKRRRIKSFLDQATTVLFLYLKNKR